VEQRVQWTEGQNKKAFNVARRTGHWDSYNDALICNKREIRKAKRPSWRRYCKLLMYYAAPNS
jgi:hypothetical protein